MTSLRTERLCVRSLDPVADVDLVFAIESDPVACEFLPFAPRTREQVAERLATDVPDSIRFVVELTDGTGIGDVLLFPPDPAGRREVGYEFLPEFWGQGYATESARAVLDWARDQGTPGFTATIAVGNVSSERTLAKLGFAEFGRGSDEHGDYVEYRL